MLSRSSFARTVAGVAVAAVVTCCAPERNPPGGTQSAVCEFKSTQHLDVVSSPAFDGSPTVSVDETELFFASARKGEQDLFVSTRQSNRDRWGIPKGMIDRGDSSQDTAHNEAWEEAGLRGRLMTTVGSYEYEKWGSSFVVTIYLMDVLVEADIWDEHRIRERAWVTFSEAMERLADHPARPLLGRALSIVSSRASLNARSSSDSA
jgi:8-oxo-dGTP pyrophosphatase MutT (NUDIX family)